MAFGACSEVNNAGCETCKFTIHFEFFTCVCGCKFFGRENKITNNAWFVVFSVNLVCKKELNLMLKMNETSSQGAVGFELRGTDSFLPILYDLNNK